MANYGGRGFARRDELARAKGFDSYNAYRRATKAEREAATARAAAAGAYRTQLDARRAAAQVKSPPALRRLHDLGGGRQLLHSMSNRELYAFLRRARDNDLRVFALVTIEPDRKVSLWKRGGIDPAYVIDDLDAANSRDVVGWITNYMVLALGYPPGTTITAIDLSSGASSEGIAA